MVPPAGSAPGPLRTPGRLRARHAPHPAGPTEGSVVRRVRAGPALRIVGAGLARRPERDPDLHAGARPGRGLEHGVTAVRGRDRLHDGQAQAAAMALAVVPAAVEAVERPGRRLLAHALARVRHLEQRALAGLG